jgi:hypothetical protein
MNQKLILSVKSSLVKGCKGFLWILKIIVPISFLTALITWSGYISTLNVIFEPVMKIIGLPAVAALPILVGLLTGIYGAIAAMAPLSLSVDQMTLVAVFVLIAHNLIQEGMVQNNSGLPFLRANLIRLTASFMTVPIISTFMGDVSAPGELSNPLAADRLSFLSMLNAWTMSTLALSGKMFVIIVTLMTVFETMKKYELIDRITALLNPVLLVLGLKKSTGFLWLTAAFFGLTYGAAVIVEEAREGNITGIELERLQVSIGINHAIVEDTALFLSLGIGFFWLVLPRFTAAIVAVKIYGVYKSFVSRISVGKTPI